MSPKVEELLLRWENLKRSGKAVTVDTLCRDCPELREEVRAQIASLEKMDQMLKLTGNGKPASNNVRRVTRYDDLRKGWEPVAGYRLERQLGKGGFGEVWKALGPGGFSLALKFVTLSGELGASELRSLEVLKTLRHPNLLAIFGAWQVHGFLIIAMELADKTLLDRLNEVTKKGQKSIAHAELMKYMVDAAKGIDYLNQPDTKQSDTSKAAVQHRDIKPQNIFLMGGGVKIGDFGLVRILKKTVADHTGSLSLNYAAPEFFMGHTSRFSDQYSLAVTYCHLRGGRLPFTGNGGQVMQGHLEGAPDLSMLSKAERPIVLRALTKKPADRWPTCSAFVEALQACLTPTNIPAHGRKWGLAKSVVAGLVLLGFLCVLGLASNYWLPQMPDRELVTPGTALRNSQVEPPSDPNVKKSSQSTTPADKNKDDDHPIEDKGIVVAAVPKAADMSQRPVGLYLVPNLKEHNVLLVKRDKGGWTRVAPSPGAKADLNVYSGTSLMSLSGSMNKIILETGVELTLWGNLPEVTQDYMQLESRVVVHANPQLDADLTLQRGRLVVKNVKTKSAQARLRFENPTLAQEEFFDISLEAGSALVFERFCELERDEPFYEDPKDPNRKGPTAIMQIYSYGGTANVTAAKVTYSMNETRQPILQWQSRKGVLAPPPAPTPPSTVQMNLPPWLKGTPPMKTPEEKQARTKATAAHDDFAKVLEKKPIDVALTEEIMAVQTAARKELANDKRMTPDTFAHWNHAIRCSSSVDDISYLFEEFSNESAPPIIRRLCLSTLHQWLALQRNHDDELFQAVFDSYKKKRTIAVKIMELFHKVSGPDARKPGTYQVLIEGLNDDLLPIRALSQWHLYALAPAGSNIAYDPAMPRQSREAAVRAWLQLVPPGQMPTTKKEKLPEEADLRKPSPLEKAIKDKDVEKEALIKQGRTLMGEKKPSLAFAAFTQAIECDRAFTLAFVERAEAANHLHQVDQAIADCNEAIRIAAPEDKDLVWNAYMTRGHAARAKKDSLLAIRSYTEAINQMPKNGHGYLWRGEALRLKNELDRSIADFDEAIRLAEDDKFLLSKAYQLRGQSYHDKGKAKIDLAKRQFNEAKKLRDQGLPFIDKAIADYTESLKYQPQVAWVYHVRGLAFGLRNDKKSAASDKNMAQKLGYTGK